MIQLFRRFVGDFTRKYSRTFGCGSGDRGTEWWSTVWMLMLMLPCNRYKCIRASDHHHHYYCRHYDGELHHHHEWRHSLCWYIFVVSIQSLWIPLGCVLIVRSMIKSQNPVTCLLALPIADVIQWRHGYQLVINFNTAWRILPGGFWLVRTTYEYPPRFLFWCVGHPSRPHHTATNRLHVFLTKYMLDQTHTYA